MVKIAEYCIRCGLCIDLHPELFAYDYENDVIRTLPAADAPEREAEIKEMIRDCAVAAISLRK